MDMMQKEEKIGTDLLAEAMENIGLSEQEFMQTHQFYMMNPQTNQILMQAQMGGGNDPASRVAPSISRQRAKEILFDSEEKKFEQMKKMMQDPSSQYMDQMTAMMEMMVQQALLSDEIFEQHGIEEEELNQAMFYYNLMHDPEVKRRMTESLNKLQMMSGGPMGGPMGGGMGGMPGMGMM